MPQMTHFEKLSLFSGGNLQGSEILSVSLFLIINQVSETFVNNGLTKYIKQSGFFLDLCFGLSWFWFQEFYLNYYSFYHSS